MGSPKYRKHSSGQARVTIQGKDFLLGKFNSPESKAKYKRLMAEYSASGCSPVFGEKASRVTMAMVATAFNKFAEAYYFGGRKCYEYDHALKPIDELYADCMAANFGPTEFKACRQWWLLDTKRSRQYVNMMAGRLLRIIKWAVGEGLIPVANYQTIKCIEPLKRGRVSAPESKRIIPVDDATVTKTIAHCTQVVGDMIRLQLLLGCRPGELVRIKPGMVDRSKDVWQIQLTEHKSAWRGKSRTIYVGPQAQAVLGRYLLRGADEYCFSPIESEKQRRQAAHEARKTPLSCGNKPGSNRTRKPKRPPGECFTTGTYCRAIKNACARAFPAPTHLSKEEKRKWNSEHAWAANQLRHSAATRIRAKFGIEAASTILGHSDLNVTQVYAEADHAKAIEVARRIG